MKVSKADEYAQMAEPYNPDARGDEWVRRQIENIGRRAEYNAQIWTERLEASRRILGRIG